MIVHEDPKPYNLAVEALETPAKRAQYIVGAERSSAPEYSRELIAG
jgi:hypothetical protein